MLGSAHFRVATLLRVGALQPPRGATCQLEARGARSSDADDATAGRRDQSRVCGHAMGQWCEHALLCNAQSTH